MTSRRISSPPSTPTTPRAPNSNSLAQFYRRGYLRWIDATTRRPDLRAERIAQVVRWLCGRPQAAPAPRSLGDVLLYGSTVGGNRREPARRGVPDWRRSLGSGGMTDTPTVALLGNRDHGLGHGGPRNILAAGLPLRVWNRTAHKARLLAYAVQARRRPGQRRPRRRCRWSRRRRRQPRRGRDGPGEGRASPLGNLAQMTTAGIDQHDLLAFAADHGLVSCPGPVSGTRQPAESGQLLVIAAGPARAGRGRARVRRRRPTTTRVASTRPTGWPASRLKLVLNSWVLAVTAGAAEALALAEALEVDPRDIPRHHRRGPARPALPAGQGRGDARRGS